MKPLTSASILSSIAWLVGLFVVVAGCNNEPPPLATKTVTPNPIRPEKTFEQWLETAVDAAEQGQYRIAKEHVRQALIQNPGDGRAMLISARLDAEEGNLSDAIATAQSIAITDPGVGVPATLSAARWLAESGRINESKSTYQVVLRQLPDNVPVRRELADLLNRVGWRYEARDVLLPILSSGSITESELRSLLNVTTSFSATQAPSENGETIQEGPLSPVLFALAVNKPREALKLIEVAMSFLPDDPHVWAAAMEANAQLQSFDEVRKAIANAPAGTDQLPLFWLAVNRLEAAQGKPDKALNAALRAFELDTTNGIAHQQLAAALVKVGRIDAANLVEERDFRRLAMIQAALAVGPNQPQDLDAGLALADDLEIIGEPMQAAAWLTLLASRHAQAQFPWDVGKKISSLTRVPQDVVKEHRYCDLEFPTPSELTLDGDLPKNLRDGWNRDIDSLRATKTLPGNQTPASFVDIAATLGIEFQYKNGATQKERDFRIFESFGGGIATFDFDLDGYVDLYCGQGDSDPPNGVAETGNSLFRNLGKKFVDVGKLAGVDDRRYTLGVTFGDLNQDGLPDLLSGNLGVNRCYINQGDGTFQEVSDLIAWTRGDFTMGFAIADLDGDTLPDVAEVNYQDDPRIFDELELGPNGRALLIPGPQSAAPSIDRVWYQHADGSMQESTLGVPGLKRSARLGDDANPGLGLLIANLDDQAGLEMFVANDARPNQLWSVTVDANGNRVQTEKALSMGLALSSRGEPTACMGIAHGDFDIDGKIDMVVTNFAGEWLNFYRQGEASTYRDVAPLFGLDPLSEAMLGFGIQAIDFDNNGSLDLVIGNGHVEDKTHLGGTFQMPTQLLVNCGDHFEPAKHESRAYWDENHLGRCVVTCDVDNDGKTDVAVADLIEPLVLLQNRTKTSNAWIDLQLVGVVSERDAIGAVVSVGYEGQSRTGFLTTGDGYEGRNEAVLHFGLAAATSPVDVSVRWPSGLESTFKNLEINQRYLIAEDSDVPWQVFRP